MRAVAAWLSGQPQLRRLELMLGAAEPVELPTLPELRSLRLRGPGVAAAGSLVRTPPQPSLREVTLTRHRPPAGDPLRFLDGWPEHPALREVSLFGRIVAV